MTKAIVVRTPGGPDAMKLEDVTVGDPGPGQIRLRQTAAGVNFIDIYQRTGLYPTPTPFTPGREGVGIVDAVGAGVTHVKVGERVAYGSDTVGGYAEIRLIAAKLVVKVPPELSDEQIAGMMLRGLTVWALLRSVFPLRSGHTVLFHAAAGGVGLIFCQWARHLGATIIGTVSNEVKANMALDAGCQHTILYRSEDWVAEVRALTDGRGVDVVYDGVGKDTFDGSLDCLATRGMMVSFGNASGPVPPVSPLVLANKGSLTLARPRMSDYVAQREDLERASEELFHMVGSNKVRVEVGQSYPLADAGVAHAALEAGNTVGSTILTC